MTAQLAVAVAEDTGAKRDDHVAQHDGRSEPARAESDDGKRHECRDQEQFVRDRVQDLAELGCPVETFREESVERIGDGRLGLQDDYDIEEEKVNKEQELDSIKEFVNKNVA
jgi:hypothetical protein